jgi:two-component system, OmpR family, response regulator
LWHVIAKERRDKQMSETSGVASISAETKGSILFVEDEEPIRDLVSTMLRFSGYDIKTAVRGSEAISEVRNNMYDLILLDVNLPDIDGFSICRKMRSDGNQTPVIFLTARDDPRDLNAGFTGGGDDYLTKPFSLEELVLRINAVLKRTRPNDNSTSRLRSVDVLLDEEACRVWRSGDEVFLSPTEFRLLRYLMQNQGRVLSKHQILNHVWDYDYSGDPSAVETYISYLRKKLRDQDNSIIRTVRGFGYSINSEETVSP